MVIVYFFLMVWLIGELKEFLTNGGVENKLAYSLLKIIFILISLSLIGMMHFSSNMMITLYTNKETEMLPSIDEKPKMVEEGRKIRSKFGELMREYYSE